MTVITIADFEQIHFHVLPFKYICVSVLYGNNVDTCLCRTEMCLFPLMLYLCRFYSNTTTTNNNNKI